MTYEEIINKFNLNEEQSIEIKKYKILPLGKATNYEGYRNNKIIGLFRTQSLEPTNNKNTRWLIKCDCGKIKCITASNFMKTYSCGCLKSQQITERNQQEIKDLTGTFSGFLEAIEPTKERLHGQVIWKCICHNCNKIHYVNSHSFINKDTQSCGCTTKSHGEIKIMNLLSQNNIPFEIQKIFSSCKNPNTQGLLRFDFWVDNKYIIEYDGEQHYIQKRKWDPLKQIQFRDKIKNEWCFNNNIPIIRIPYWKYDTLEIKDLLLKTSSYIISL